MQFNNCVNNFNKPEIAKHLIGLLVKIIMPGFTNILQCKVILNVIIKLNYPETIYLKSYSVLREVPRTFSLLEKWKTAKEPVESLTQWCLDDI